jgi:gentisate 1,2-dioxygenase
MTILDRELAPSTTTSSLANATEDEFYASADANFLPPIWKHASWMVPFSPVVDAQPHVWRYETVREHLVKAAKDIRFKDEDAIRILVLNNPGLAEMKTPTRNVYAAMQLVKPGEVAAPHRHTQSALRFILEGAGSFSTVEGDRFYHELYDLVITPPWTWHDHGNLTKEPAIWMEGLDITLMRALDMSFFDLGPYEFPGIRDNVNTRKYGNGSMVPAWQRPAKTTSTPMLIYRWSETYAALKEMAELGEASPFDDIAMVYTNPENGGPVLPTIGCWAQMLRPGIHTKAHRHTTSAVYNVVSGSGYSVINGQRIDWKKGDTFALPPWSWHEHVNGSATEEALLFSVTDHPLLESLGLYREERLIVDYHPGAYKP